LSISAFGLSSLNVLREWPKHLTTALSGWKPAVQVSYNSSLSCGWLPPLMLLVSCDMKLQSVLLGWKKFLTKPCVSPQVFHGSMRLAGSPESFRDYCQGVRSLPGNVSNLAASSRERARIGGQGQN